MKMSNSVRSYMMYLKQFWVRVVGIFLLFCLSDGLLAIVPVFIGRLIGTLSITPIDQNAVVFNTAVLIGCSVLHGISWHGTEVLYRYYINPLSYRYESEMARFVLQKPYPFFVGKYTGKIASYITTIGKETRLFTDRLLYNYSQGVVKLVSISIILLSVNTITGVVFLAGIAMMVFVGRFTIRNSIKYESIFTDIESTKNGKIIDIVSNFVNVKSFQKEDVERQAIVDEQEVVIDAANRSFTWGTIFWISMSVVIRFLLWPTTVLINVVLYLNGSVSLAELTTLLSTIMLFSSQVWDYVWYVSQYNLAVARLEEAHTYLFGKRVVHALRYPPKISTRKTLAFRSELHINGLQFAYPDQPDQMVLRDINLTIKRGEKIGVVGKSGSGKTTLVKLLLGYYDLDEEAIILDGKNVENKHLLDVIAYVPQDTTLFNRTIAENIAYAVGGKVTRKKLIEVSEHALADEFISKITKTYDAVVGERGVKLSTGQRQRIAIARAMLQDKPLLILDEATSALDSENEVLVQQSLENLWDERTVISIAHRLSTLRKMDRIVVFDDGRIVEQGSMSELLKNKGPFYELWNHQVNGMILE